MKFSNLKINKNYCLEKFEENELKLIFEDDYNLNNNSINKVFEYNFFNNDYISIFFNNTEVGYIEYNAYENCMYLEYIKIYEDYQRKKIGCHSLSILIDICKLFNLSFINGECRNDLISFYKKLGAKFENRTPEDEAYINNRFYIDLI